VELLPFIGVAAAVIVTPGVDMALVGRNAVVHGKTAGLSTALGVNLGVALWACAAAAGVATIVRASAEVFTVLKLLGAAYLVYLGVQAWLRGGRRRDDDALRGVVDPREAFRQGVLSNLLNPKIGVFFTALLPQFAPPSEPLVPLLVLGGIFNLMGIAWLTAYAVIMARGGEFLRRPRIGAAIERLTGTLLIGLGVRVALERRPLA
jgi:threonine/homoserine/homoserine lactone efflux protein